MFFSKIYVICPAYTKTGGTELLHQLVYILNCNGIDSAIAYVGATAEKNMNPAFKSYVSSFFFLEKIINNDGVFVIPETMTRLLKKIDPAKCIIWWESVNNYHQTFSQSFHDNSLFFAIKKMFSEKIYFNPASFSLVKLVRFHLVQSFYAKQYLCKHGIQKNVFELKDYLNQQYLEMDNSEQMLKEKTDIICYNPKKGHKITKRIIKKFKCFTFVPLINMTNREVASTLKKAKIYIDFGNHPGMDRMPREAAMAHCCVITNRCGSAFYQEDVPIPEKFKFNDYHLDYHSLFSIFNYCLSNYPLADMEFNSYRHFIFNQYSEFTKDALAFFGSTLFRGK